MGKSLFPTMEGTREVPLGGQFMSAHSASDGLGVVSDGPMGGDRDHKGVDLCVLLCGVTTLGPQATDRVRVRGKPVFDGVMGVARNLVISDGVVAAFDSHTDAGSVLEDARSQLRREEGWFEQLEATKRTARVIRCYDQWSG